MSDCENNSVGNFTLQKSRKFLHSLKKESSVLPYTHAASEHGNRQCAEVLMPQQLPQDRMGLSWSRNKTLMNPW